MTTGNEPLADARDMFAAHTMFRREFGLMPGLVRAVAAGDSQRAALAGAVDRLLPVMNEHLAVEEERVVPLIEKFVTQAEYANVAQEQGAEAPPDKLPVMIGMFVYEAEPAAIDLAVAEMPAEVRPVIRDLPPGRTRPTQKNCTGPPPRPA